MLSLLTYPTVYASNTLLWDLEEVAADGTFTCMFGGPRKAGLQGSRDT